jgi:hypothetical protein
MPLDASSMLPDVRTSAGVRCVLWAVIVIELCGICGREDVSHLLFALDSVQVLQAL